MISVIYKLRRLNNYLIFAARCYHAMQARPIVPTCLSVSRPSRSWTLSNTVETNKHILSSKFFQRRVTNHTVLVFPYHTIWQYSDGDPPNGGVEYRWGIDTNRDSRRIQSGYRSMTGGVRTTATVHLAVYRTDRHVSVHRSQTAWMPWTTTTKRKEFICKQR